MEMISQTIDLSKWHVIKDFKTKNIEVKNLILHFCNVLTGSLSFFAIGKQQFLDQGIMFNDK